MEKTPDLSYVQGTAASIISMTLPFVFSLMVVADAVKAFKKRAHWVPGNTLALSALTIQAISFFFFFRSFRLSIEVNESYDPCQDIDDDLFTLFLENQVIFDFGKLNICVFIGYVFPGIENLKLILALVICVVGQISSELYYVQEHSHVMTKKPVLFWFFLSSIILYFSMIFLIFILVCTVIAGNTLRGILKKRIAAIVSAADEVEESQIICPSPEDDPDRTQERGWKDFENEVFKSWILGRICQPDYVISRSVLSSAVGLVVTICVMFCFFKTILVRENKFAWLYSCATWPFIMLAWVVICWRWLAAVFYSSKLKLPGRIWILFRIEEFWTRSIVELIHVCELKVSKLDPQSKDKCLTRFVVKIRLYKLLHMVKALQTLLVLVSKSCQLLSEILFTPFMFFINWLLLTRFMFIINWLLGLCFSTFQGQRAVSTSDPYKDFAITLKRVCMPGEDPASLWKANLSAIKKIELSMEEGRIKGRHCEILDSYFKKFSHQWIDKGVELMDKLKRERLWRVHHYFPHLDKPCWKMTAVSLLRVIVGLEGKKSGRVITAVKACREAWDVMNLVDNACVGDQMLNLIGDIIVSDSGCRSDIASAYEVQVSIAADIEFSRLQTLCEQLPPCSLVVGESNELQSVDVDASSQRGQCIKMCREAAAELEASKLLVDENEIEGEMPTRCQDNEEADADFELHDALDWVKIAPHYSLYRLCRVIDGRDHVTDPDLAYWAEKSLRNIIACCLSRLPDMLVKYSRLCAQEFDEDSLWKTIYLAGKARGLMEKLGVPRMKPREQLIQMEWRQS